MPSIHGLRPFPGPGLPNGLSRRTLLGGLAALTLGSVAACQLNAPDQQQPGGGRRPTGERTLGGSDPAGYAPRPPFSLQVGSELSEDYFTVQNCPVDPAADTLMAYSRADGRVEAVMLAGGVVRQIYADASQPGGWNANPLPDAADVTAMVAAVSGPLTDGDRVLSPATLKVFYLRSGVPNTLFVAVETAPGGPGAAPTFQTTSAPWNDAARGLQIAVNCDQSVLVSGIVPSSADNFDGRLYFWTDAVTYDAQNQPHLEGGTGYLTGFDYQPQTTEFISTGAQGGSWKALVARPTIAPNGLTLLLFLPRGSYGQQKLGPIVFNPPSVNSWSWPVVAGAQSGATMTNWSATTMPGASPTNSTAYTIEYASTLGSSADPQLVIRTMEVGSTALTQKLWLLSPNDLHKQWQWTPLVLPTVPAQSDAMAVSVGIRPLPDTEQQDPTSGWRQSGLMDVFTLAAGQFSVIRQAPTGDALTDYVDPSYCPAIALQSGVAGMVGQAGQSSGNELLVVGTDKLLHALTRDPVSGQWTDTTITLPATDLQQLTTYRTDLLLVDSWGMPIPGTPVQVSAGSTVTALVDGQAVVLGPQPVTVTTGVDGRVLLALPADGLSAPTLTVTGANLATATIAPSAPINSYLQGGTTLGYLPAFSQSTLAAATTPDGSKLAPGMSDAGTAQAAISNIGTAAGWADAPTLRARRPASVRRVDGRLRVRRPNGKLSTTRSIITSIDSWFHDALHAIKTGAVEVSAITVDAADKTFTVAAGFSQWADQEITIVVQGVEDAAHVVHAVLNQLKADIVAAIDWLKSEVLQLLKDSAALAAQFDEWLGQCASFVGTQLGQDATKVTAWLAAKQATVDTKLAALVKGVSDSTTLQDLSAGSLSAQPKATAKPGLRDPSSSFAPGSAHASWLLSKVKQELTGSTTIDTIANAETLLTNFTTALSAAGTDLQEAGASFWSFLGGSLKDPSGTSTVGVARLLNTLRPIVDAVFTFVSAVVDAAMAWFAATAALIPQLLGTPLSQTPVIGGLAKLLGVGSMSLGTIVCLLFAFPTTLAYKLLHQGQGRPFASVAANPRPTGRELEGLADDFRFVAASLTGLGAIFDTISIVVSDPDDDEVTTIFDWVDFIGPLLLAGFTLPSNDSGVPVFVSPLATDGDQVLLEYGAWLAGVLPAFATLTTMIIKKKFRTADFAKPVSAAMPLVVFGSGVFGLGLSCTATLMDADPPGSEFATDILTNMPAASAILQTPPIQQASDGLSVAVGLALTWFCGIGGALVMGLE